MNCADYYGLQAAEDPCEITLRYLTGQADFTDFVFDGKCGFVHRLPVRRGISAQNSAGNLK